MRFSKAEHMKRMIAKAIACSIMLLVLPGCHIFDLRQPQPAPVMPATFNGVATPENSAQLGIEEFYDDPTLTSLIDQALFSNRELRVLNEEVQIASNEILARSGAYLPFLTGAVRSGFDRASRFTEVGAGLLADPYLPGRFFTNPHGDFLNGINFWWQLDIYRQLRNARDAASLRYCAAFEKRNYFVTRLVADVAENYYKLMALDKRLENLDQIIQFQEGSLEIARARLRFARGTLLAVLRFQAEVQRNQSEKLIIYQQIIEVENRINFLANRYPQRVERASAGFYDLNLHALSVGVPSQLLLNRPDIRQAERELAAAGLDIKVARANFFPQLIITGDVGLEAFIFNHLFEPQAVAGGLAGGLVGPLVNFRSIRAQYYTANARQLQACYNYQRTILDAFTQVINRMAMVQNFTNSIRIKRQQLQSLEAAVDVANNLFKNAQTEYLDVLTAQRDLRDGRVALIDAKQEQLTAIVNAYQALGGGDLLSMTTPQGARGPFPCNHIVRAGETWETISRLYYKSERYAKALWAANKKSVPALDRLCAGNQIIIPPPDALDLTLIANGPPLPPLPQIIAAPLPADISAPPPSDAPGPDGRKEGELPPPAVPPPTEVPRSPQP
jgi:NodT family efflux transporter outer membrane factor (OMF) lipoprotein